VPSTTQPVQRTVALSAVHVDEGFNPRDDAQRAEITGLAESIRTHGLVRPLVVTAVDGNGAYRLIDGERRYRACVDAAIVEVPVIVRDADEATAALDVALVANMARVDLSPLEQAKAFARLIDRGLTRKGVAERIGVSQKLVRERLAILDLPEDLHAQVGDATIPPAAIRPLVELAKIHPGLPAVAVSRILEPDPDAYYEAWAWGDLAADALAVVIDRGASSDHLPEDVFVSGVAYPLERFRLEDKAARRLEALAELQAREADSYAIRFERADVEAAAELGAAHSVQEGWQSLIVGQDVADQLAGDQIAAAHKAARGHAKAIRQAQEAGDGDAAGQGAADPGGAQASEEQLAAERRREREAQQEACRAAVAYNDELGAAVVKHFGRLKIDGRVVKILAAVDFGGDLDKIAMRGARYGLPGFERSEQLKSGKTKRTYLQAGPAGAQARTFLDNAGKSPGDLAGRMVALAVMARYANEDAVAQSSRSFAQVDGGSALPWSLETVELIDLCAERLPAHLLERGREQREQARRERHELAELRAWTAQQLAALEEMTAQQRAAVLAEADRRNEGFYGAELWRLRQRVAQLDAADAKPDGGEEA
jgi:ParB/RepB/Spo0J family partition protein